MDGEEEGISSEDEKFLLFALLCLQIAYPPVYSLLTKEPNFPIWDDALAFKETNRSEERSGDNERLSPEEMKKIFDGEFEIAKQSEDFDEDWEQALYRICYGRPRMKPRVADISRFFSYIKDELLSDQQEIIGETISRLLTQTSVTSVTSTDQGQQQPSTRSKWATDEQVEELSQFRKTYLTAIKDAGSKVYGARNPGKSFAWYMRFKAKKDSFSDPKFMPRWGIGFFGGLSLRVDGEETDSNINLLQYFEDRMDYLKAELDPSYGDWVVFYKEGTMRKFIAFRRKDLEKIQQQEKAMGGAGDVVKDEQFINSAIEWSCHVIPIFERLVIEIIEEFIEKNGKILTSQGGYSG